jgi:hypothetical protein
MVGIVIARARHTAKIRAKSLIVSEKTILIIAHLCSEMAVFAVICTVYMITVKARSRTFYVLISKYITGTDRRTVCARTVLSLTQPFNTGYRVKVFSDTSDFAKFIDRSRDQIITNPIR